MAEAKQVDFLISGLCDSSGTPLVSGLVYFYETDGVTLKDIWEDSGATVTAANPVTLDSRGTAVIFAEGVYDVVIKDSSGVTLSTPDGLSYDLTSEDGEIVASDYGGFTGATIATAIATAAGDDATVILSPGNWLVTDNLTIPANINLKFLFGAYLTISAAKTVTYNGVLEATPYNIHRGAGTVVFNTSNPIILTIWKISAVAGNVDYTGTHSFTGQVNADNLRLDGNTVSSTSGNLILDSFGTITLNDAIDSNVTITKATPVLHINSSTDTAASLLIDGGLTSAASITFQQDGNSRWTIGQSSGATPFVIANASGGNALSINYGSNVLTGNGSGFTNLNASNISSGELALARGGTGVSLVAVNNATFVSNGSGVISLSTTLPTAVQSNITTLGTITSDVTINKNDPLLNMAAANDGTVTIKMNAGPSADTDIQLLDNSALVWNVGMDGSDSNALVFSAGGAIGTGNRLKITTAGVISGDGSGLTALNATNLSSGTIDSARVSGSYTGITGVGTLLSNLTVGTGTADRYVDVDGAASAGNGGTFRFLRGGSVIGQVGSYDAVSGGNTGDVVLRAAAGKALFLQSNATTAIEIDTSQNMMLSNGPSIGGATISGRINLPDHTTAAGGLYIGSDVILYRTGAAAAKLEAALQITGDLYTVAKTDYFGSSTITGWTTPSGTIYYKKIGFQVWVAFAISGTSNSTTTSFTLPYAAAGSSDTRFLCTGDDNGTALAGWVKGALNDGSSTVAFYTSAADAGWTAANTKLIRGQFWYFTGS